MFYPNVDYSSDAQHKASPLMLTLHIEIQMNSNLNVLFFFFLCTEQLLELNRASPGLLRLFHTAETWKEPGAS